MLNFFYFGWIIKTSEVMSCTLPRPIKLIIVAQFCAVLTYLWFANNFFLIFCSIIHVDKCVDRVEMGVVGSAHATIC